MMKKPLAKILAAALLAILAPLAAAQTATTANPEAIGSLDGARVAYPVAPGAAPHLVYIASARLTDEQLADLQAVARNVEIIRVASYDEALKHAHRAHGVESRFVDAEFLAAAPSLVWVQSTSAGVDSLMEIEPLVADDDIVVTNMRAVHGPAIADHAMAMLLMLTRDLRTYEARQRDGQWMRGGDLKGMALEGRTMFVVGLGGIGTEIAQRAKGFGMHVIASKRTMSEPPEFVDEIGTPDQLHEMLARADVVAIAAPLTAQTQNLFDAAAFAAMKPGAILINIGRGQIVNTDALLAALDSGRLAGAGLDVTDPEPLPEGHPLWSRENVIITPHVASVAELTSDRWWSIYRENLRRFAHGEPLMNTVDKAAGY